MDCWPKVDVAQRGTGGDGEAMQKGNGMVLVVEDDGDLLQMVQLVLEGAGYRTTAASEGGEALARIAEGMPSVILLDMKMPGMDGWEFARRFRELHDRSAPLVVLTAAENARQRAEEIGAEDYLGKPFDIDALLDKVGRYAEAETVP
ncbi:MAG: response regulator [Anaerolineae bacterium]